MQYKKKYTKIIILCGGKGKRLGNITKKIPKPLVKIKGYPIIDYKLNYYKKQGLKDFVFCTGYKSKILKKYLKKKCTNPIFVEGELNCGILKRIYSARHTIDKSTIVSYCDTFAKINFKDLLKKHKKSKAALTIVVAPIQNPFGIVNWNESGKLKKFEEKPILNHFIGYSVIEPNIFKYLNRSIINLKNGKGMVKAIQQLILKKKVNVYQFKGLQLTVNSPSQLIEAKKKIGNYFTLNESL